MLLYRKYLIIYLLTYKREVIMLIICNQQNSVWPTTHKLPCEQRYVAPGNS